MYLQKIFKLSGLVNYTVVALMLNSRIKLEFVIINLLPISFNCKQWDNGYSVLNEVTMWPSSFLGVLKRSGDLNTLL